MVSILVEAQVEAVMGSDMEWKPLLVLRTGKVGENSVERVRRGRICWCSAPANEIIYMVGEQSIKRTRNRVMITHICPTPQP
jgi:hypothetical protein